MKKIIAFIFLIITMTAICYAEEDYSHGGAEELLTGSGTEEIKEKIPKAAREHIGENDDISDAVDAVQPQTLIKTITGTVRRYMTAPLRMLVSLCGIMILCAMLEIFHTTLNASGGRNIFQIVISVAIASIILTPVVECILETSVILHDFSLFIITYIPVFAGVITAAGQPLTGSAYNIFLFWICQTTSQLISSCFVPMLCGYLALAVTSVVCPSMQLGKLVGGIKTFVVWGLTLTLTIFVGLLSIQSVVASGGDNITVKTAKFMIGSLVPGVGNALSDLFMAAQGCIQLAKGTLGAFGVIVTLFTFLPILVKVMLWYLSLAVAAQVGNILGTTEISGLMKNISSTLGILIAVLLYDGLLVIISTTIIIVTFKAG